MVNSVSGNILWDRLQGVDNSQTTGTGQNSKENGSGNATGVNSGYDNFMTKLQGLMQSSDTGANSLTHNNTPNTPNNGPIDLVLAFKNSFSTTTNSTDPTTTGSTNPTTTGSTSGSEGTLLASLQGLVHNMFNQWNTNSLPSTGGNISAKA